MKNAIVLIIALTGLSASATDLNGLLKRVCAEIPNQSPTAHVKPEQCAADPRLKIEGSPSTGSWWGSVIFMDPRGGASFTCEFRVNASDALQVYLCDRYVSRGE